MSSTTGFFNDLYAHHLNVEKPSEFNRIVLEFLARSAPVSNYHVEPDA